MAAKALTCDNLGELNDGAARLAIDAALHQAVLDVDDRGTDRAKRKVVIEITLERFSDGEIASTVKVATKVPAYKTDTTVHKLRHVNNQLEAMFQPASPNNPDQEALPFPEKKPKE